MRSITRHITKCFVAGIVAILPIGGLIIMVGYLELTISESGLTKLPFYFPGFGLIAAAVLIYLIGLSVTTFVGKWVWEKMDRLIDNLPALGKLYVSLKQILGYGEGKDAIFKGTVLVPVQDKDTKEIDLVTNEIVSSNGSKTLVVFVPGSPNPTTGRLIIVEAHKVEPITMPVNEALKALVAAGATELAPGWIPAGPDAAHPSAVETSPMGIQASASITRDRRVE